MTSTSSVRRLAACSAIVLAVVGCGSHKKVIAPLSDCEVLAENTAAAAEVKKAYDAGDLGSAKQLRAHFTDVQPSAYLNADGTLKPYSQLKGDARRSFESWMNDEVAGRRDKVGERIRAAEARVRASSVASGKPCNDVAGP
jgi:hypothetical protein